MKNDSFENKAINAIEAALTGYSTNVIAPRSVDSVGFPATRYYGSKKKLASWLSKIFRAETFMSALDPFGGTGIVSFLLASQGKNVFYRDFFKWSTTCAAVLLEPQKPLLSSTELSCFLKNVRPKRGFISTAFENAYYLDSENKWLDGACDQIGQIANLSTRNQLWYLVIQASLRKRPFNLFHRQNLHLRQSRLSIPTFGNHSTWARSFESHIFELHAELVTYKQHSIGTVSVLPSGDVLSNAPPVDLVYLDPPYLAVDRYSESYLDRYHFLEGMVDYENWPNRIVRNKKKVSIDSCSDAHSWSSKEQLTDLLLGTVSAYSDSIVVLSYAEGSIPPRQIISEFFKDTFASVSVYQRQRAIAMSSKPLTELVFVGRP